MFYQILQSDLIQDTWGVEIHLSVSMNKDLGILFQKMFTETGIS
jgi:hypothetical protein